MLGIGELSRTTGCPIETIRYYERLGLLDKPHRTEGGHRLYNLTQQKRLQFIVKARQLGFSLEKTRELLSLSENNTRSCDDALQLVENNVADIQQKITQLQLMEKSLRELAGGCRSCCPNAKAPDCSIIDALAH
ncbi:helix-turn-helix domain-containing protein [Cellvibrio sp. pealriver]|uniref:MerR family transcriptional regulator n=1 Tax=Cellvibrio sp. pealriver TaxID=1622269 RepID=UPI00066FC183|nr:helix-turn-helix domain-containing protein [Cellvibrio sp. pealriver]